MTAIQVAVAVICYLGVIAGAFLPYYRKKNDISHWDMKYTWVVAAACVESALALESAILDYAASVTQWDGLLVPAFTAFMTGFGMVSGTSEAMKLLRNLGAKVHRK